MKIRITLAAFVTATLLLVGCGGDTPPDNAERGTGVTDEVALFDAATVHEVQLTFDQADYDAMLEELAESGEKTWIDVTVSIDGVTYEHAGARLKGNSSLAGLVGGFGGPIDGFPDDFSDYSVDQDSYSVAEDGYSVEAEVELLDMCFYYEFKREMANGEMVNLGPQPFGDDGVLPDFDYESAATDGGRPEGFVEVVEPWGPEDEVSAERPEKLPWLIRLDRFVEGQQHQGYADIVIRSNFSKTSLNEALALDLLEQAGLASQAAAHVRFTVKGGESALRLMIEHPSDDAWQDRNFAQAGALYKAESTGDWSYRGDKPAAYDEVFDQEGGRKVADLTPLIEFLEFVNEADDATFAAELPERLDVESFATYLAMMELLHNWDDIDGPGNNAYLWWDRESAQFSVVPWDMNLALDGFAGGFEGTEVTVYYGEPPEDFEPLKGFEPPEDFELPEWAKPSGDFELPEDFDSSQCEFEICENKSDTTSDTATPSAEDFDPSQCEFWGSNPLVKRFHANTELESLYQEKLEELKAKLFASQTADKVLAARVAVLTKQAADLVETDIIQQEADAITQLLSQE